MKARRGKSRPGSRVFIYTRPAVNGRKDALKRTRADVPPPKGSGKHAPREPEGPR
jgi:hypothetical protein